MTEIIVEALGKTGQRGIICRGTLAEPKGFVYLLDDDDSCPHDWLFPRCKAVCPTTIVYFFGDRSFWGDRVHERLLWPAPIPVEELSLPKLVDAIEFLMNPQVKVKAVELAKVWHRKMVQRELSGHSINTCLEKLRKSLRSHHHIGADALHVDFLAPHSADHIVDTPCIS